MKPVVREILFKVLLITLFIASKLCLVLTKGQVTLPALQMKSVKTVFVTLIQDERNCVHYISFNDKKRTSQQYKIKTVPQMHTHVILPCRIGAIFHVLQSKRTRSACIVTSHFLCSLKKREKITLVLQANLMANLQSDNLPCNLA